MPFRTYGIFVRFHYARILLLILLPHVIFGAGCLFVGWFAGDMRFPAAVWVLLTFLHLFHMLHEESNAALSPQRKSEQRATPTHALNFIEHRLRAAGLIDSSIEIVLDRETLGSAYVSIESRPYRIVLPAQNIFLWKHGVTEAVIMHEVGHTKPLCSTAYKQSGETTNKVWLLAGQMCGVTACFYSMPYIVIVIMLGCICTLCGIAHLVVRQPLLHSIEYIADSNVPRMLGQKGLRLFVKYFEEYMASDERLRSTPTHPAPKDRIAALMLCASDTAHSTSHEPQPTHA